MEIEKPYYNKDINVFAETNFRDQRKAFGIKKPDRQRHMYIVGKTGMGKTTMMEHMIVQDIKAGEGLCVLDSNGSLVNELLYYVPSRRLKDVIFLNPEDLEYPISWNLLGEPGDELEQQELVQGLLNIFKSIWKDVWGPRMEYVFKNILLTLLIDENNTLLHILPLLTDEKFRKSLIGRLTDPGVKDFWENEYQQFPERFESQAIEPLKDKIGQLTSTPLLRNIIGQADTHFSFKDIINKQKIVILVLNKSKIGDEATRMLGACFTLKLLLAAKQAKRNDQLKDFYFYIDGFQNFGFSEFSELITSTDLGLNLILSNQYLEQISAGLQKDIFGNIDTVISFKVGAADAQALGREMGVPPDELMKLSKFNIMLTLLIDGETSAPFTAQTLEPLPVIGLRDKIIAYSRKKYSHRRDEAEQSIMKSLKINSNKIQETDQEEDQAAINNLNIFREKITEISKQAEPDITLSEKKDLSAEAQLEVPNNAKELSPGEEVEF